MDIVIEKITRHVTIRWAPAHSKVTGNEQADTYAKAAARRSTPYNDDDDVPDGLLTEASLSRPGRGSERSGWPATCAPGAGTGPHREEAFAASIYATPGKSWTGGTTSSSQAMDHSGGTSREGKRSTRIGAGFATPASATPSFTSSPGARLGPARHGPCGKDWKTV